MASKVNVTENMEYSEVPRGSTGRFDEYGKLIQTDKLLEKGEFDDLKREAFFNARIKELQILEELTLRNNEFAAQTQAADLALQSAILATQEADRQIKLLQDQLHVSNTGFRVDNLENEVALLQNLARTHACKQAQVETEDATDLSTALVLINELKAKINAMNS